MAHEDIIAVVDITIAVTLYYDLTLPYAYCIVIRLVGLGAALSQIFTTPIPIGRVIVFVDDYLTAVQIATRMKTITFVL